MFYVLENGETKHKLCVSANNCFEAFNKVSEYWNCTNVNHLHSGEDQLTLTNLYKCNTLHKLK